MPHEQPGEVGNRSQLHFRASVGGKGEKEAEDTESPSFTNWVSGPFQRPQSQRPALLPRKPCILSSACEPGGRSCQVGAQEALGKPERGTAEWHLLPREGLKSDMGRSLCVPLSVISKPIFVELAWLGSVDQTFMLFKYVRK